MSCANSEYFILSLPIKREKRSM